MKKIFKYVLILFLLSSCYSINEINEKLLLHKMEYGSNIKDVLSRNVTLEFENNKAFGQSFNNIYSSTYYQKKLNTIIFDEIASTKMAGSKEDMELEKIYFSLLTGERKYERTDKNVFEIYNDKNEKLSFINITSKTDLDKRTFILENDSSVSISFDGDNFYGKLPVNTYFGNYSLKNNNIKLENIATTLMSSNKENMDKENSYLEYLNKPYIINLYKNQLILMGENNISLKFIEKKVK